jgi:predicted Holliday junction resolvase-like endonuclease
MFRFTIRDVLWLTVVVAVALTFWLGWSRNIAKLREESAAREAKLNEQAAADNEQMRINWNALHSEYTKVRVQLQKQHQNALPTEN